VSGDLSVEAAVGGAIEKVGHALVVFLPGGQILSFNPAAEKLYGYRAADVVGLTVADLVPAEDRAADAGLRRRALAGERLVDVPVRRLHRDGTPLELVADLFPVPGGFVPTPTRTDNGNRVLEPDEHLAMLERLPGIVFTCDLDGALTYTGGGALARVGLKPGEAVGLNLRDFTDNPVSLGLLEDLLGGKTFQGPINIGGINWDIWCGPTFDGNGGRNGSTGVLIVSDDTWDQASTVAAAQARYQALAEHSTDLVGIIDPTETITYVSPSITDLLGWQPEEVVGRHASEFIRMDPDLAPDPTNPNASGRTYRMEARLRHAGGEWRYFEVVTTDYLDDPSIGGFVCNARDITERRIADRQLRHANLHDGLTDLPNRALLIEKVDAILERHEVEQPSRMAVVVIGLDRFKLVNDSLGVDIGDQLLIAVAQRLRTQVRAGDSVARLGGDTFAVTTTGVADATDARALATRLIATISEPYDLDGRRIAVTAGAGVAVSDGDSPGASLVRDADTAMYAAKRTGRSRVEVFEPRLRSDAARQLALEQTLSRATAAGELRVHFQPIMALAGDVGEQLVSGVEALVRWEHPELGLVPPFDFIPLAEETGHIVEIGAWVLRESCRTLMEWANGAGREAPNGERRPPLRLSVNLSPRQLLEPDLSDVVAQILTETGFPVDRLTMEVTESVLVDEGPYATTTLRRLRELGVRLSIDDFGTGYSSLVYLRRLNADALKIDRSFVDGLGRDSEADAIVRTVISLATSLGLDLVAEGVETEEQRRLLIELGCQFAQGYLFSRPLPGPAFEAWRSAGGELRVP
jgi:diguanylate cyclase (GGDEF)-like protein/PAS domain S-box-containing protein